MGEPGRGNPHIKRLIFLIKKKRKKKRRKEGVNCPGQVLFVPPYASEKDAKKDVALAVKWGPHPKCVRACSTIYEKQSSVTVVGVTWG